MSPKVLAVLLLSISQPYVFAETAADIYKAASPSVFLISTRGQDGSTISIGTGFLIGPGQLATNWHVIEAGNAFLETGAVSIPVEIISRDELNDLAIVKVKANISATPLKLSAKSITPGQSVFVIGNPEGLEKSITNGVVSGIRVVNDRKLMQISAPISPGSSGGPVLDSSGEVVGITVAMLTEGQNLNFAVPVPQLIQLIESPGSAKQLDLDRLLQEVNELKTSESGLDWSANQNSDYQRFITKSSRNFHLLLS